MLKTMNILYYLKQKENIYCTKIKKVILYV